MRLEFTAKHQSSNAADNRNYNCTLITTSTTATDVNSKNNIRNSDEARHDDHQYTANGIAHNLLDATSHRLQHFSSTGRPISAVRLLILQSDCACQASPQRASVEQSVRDRRLLAAGQQQEEATQRLGDPAGTHRATRQEESCRQQLARQYQDTTSVLLAPIIGN